MRSNGVPPRAASTMARTAMRTSSSASVVDTISSRPLGSRRRPGATVSGPPASVDANGATSASAAGSPVRPSTTSTVPCSPMVASSSSSSGRSRCGRWTTMRRSRAGRSPAARSTARASRSPSSYHPVRSDRATSAATRAGSLPRPVRARAVIEPAPAWRSSRYRSRQARRSSTGGAGHRRRARGCRGRPGARRGRRPGWNRPAALGMERRRAEQLGERNGVRTSMAANPPAPARARGPGRRRPCVHDDRHGRQGSSPCCRRPPRAHPATAGPRRA